MRFYNFFKSLSTVVSYPYNVWASKGVIDPYAFPIIRDSFPEILEEIKDYSKRGAGYYSLMETFDEVASGPQNEDLLFGPEQIWMLDLATKQVRCRLGDWKVEPYSIDEALDCIHLDTSAGYGYPGKLKGEVIGEIYDQATQMAIDAMELRPQVPVPCILGTRGTLKHRSEKGGRLIYNMPAAVVLNEQRFVAPLIRRCKEEKDYPIMFGGNVIPRLSQMNSNIMYPKGSYSVELDVSKFDRNLRTASLRRAFSVMEDMIDFDHWKGRPLRSAIKDRWMRVWDFTVYYFLHTPVMKPNGELKYLDGSVPSGSSYTQFVESILSMIMFTYWTLAAGHAILNLRSLGDDCRGVVFGRVDKEYLKKVYKEVFDATINEKKTRIVRADVNGSEFLGYQFRNGFLYRETLEWFKLMLYPEHEVKNLQVSFSRLIAYMFLGGCNDVEFTRFFEKYQGSWPLENWDYYVTKDVKAKIMYGGLHMPIKPLLEYKFEEFVFSLITFK